MRHISMHQWKQLGFSRESRPGHLAFNCSTTATQLVGKDGTARHGCKAKRDSGDKEWKGGVWINGGVSGSNEPAAQCASKIAVQRSGQGSMQISGEVYLSRNQGAQQARVWGAARQDPAGMEHTRSREVRHRHVLAQRISHRGRHLGPVDRLELKGGRAGQRGRMHPELRLGGRWVGPNGAQHAAVLVSRGGSGAAQGGTAEQRAHVPNS